MHVILIVIADILTVSGGDKMSEKKTGTIKWFNIGKGFGFIDVEDEPKDVFVHMSALSEGTEPGDLVEGTKVEFKVEKSDKGPQATHVRKV